MLSQPNRQQKLRMADLPIASECQVCMNENLLLVSADSWPSQQARHNNASKNLLVHIEVAGAATAKEALVNT